MYSDSYSADQRAACAATSQATVQAAAQPTASESDESKVIRRRETRRAAHVNQQLLQAECENRCAYALTEQDARAMRARLRDGALASPFPLLYARTTYWNQLSPVERELHVIRGAHELHRDWVFCSYSAALVYGLSVSYHLLGCVHVLLPRGVHTASTQRIKRHVGKLGATRLVGGVTVTPLMETVLDCLLTAPLPDALAIADSALRRYNITASDLQTYVKRHGYRRHGIKRALRAASLVDARAESGGESALRGVIIEAGYLPPTDLQVELPDPTDPRRTFRPDLFWQLGDGRQIAGELDGRGKYEDSAMLAGRDTLDALLDERQRESRITALGLPVMRFLASRLREQGYVARILEAFGIPRAA